MTTSNNRINRRILGSPATRLYLLAGVFVFLSAVSLTISPAIRARSWDVEYNWGHWIGVLIWMAVFGTLNFISRRFLTNFDAFLIPLAALLSGWGMLTIWRLSPYFGLRQSIWLIIAAGAFLVVLRLPSGLETLRHFKYLWLVGGLGITALTLIFGTNPLGVGPRLWLGCCGIYLQPSEPLKLLLIIYLAAYLADRQPFTAELIPLLAPTIVMTGITLLLLLVQRDLGTATIFVVIFISVLYAATSDRRILVAGFVLVLIAGVAGYGLFDVVRLRVDAWLNPWLDPSGRSYQIVQSLIAIANGGLLGRGPGVGSPGLVPIPHSDFIFTSMIEEAGFLGAIALFILLAIFSTHAIKISMSASNRFHRYLGIGITTFLASQSILIIGGNIRFLPLTGVTLPFISYGGSSLVSSFIALGLLAQISSRGRPANLFAKENSSIFDLSIFLLGGILAAALVTGWWSVIRGPDLLTRTDNARRAIADRHVLRGSLVDRNFDPINVTIGEPASYERVYLHPELGVVTGYTHPVYGQSGAEASLDDYLRGLANQAAQDIWFSHLLYGQPPPGLDVQLSLDLSLQKKAEALLNGNSGAVVMINAETGEILVLASSPNFDPSTLDEDAEALNTDPSSPLLNRATQASFQPGRILGPWILAAALQQGDLPALPTNMSYKLGAPILTCAAPVEDPLTWGDAVTAGCPNPLAQLGIQVNGANLLAAYRDAGFTTAPEIRLPTASDIAPISIAVPGESAIGQGQLRVTPLQLAHAAAALINDGIQMPLRFALQVQNPDGSWTELAPLGESIQSLPASIADKVIGLISIAGEDTWHILAEANTGEENTLTWYLSGTTPGSNQNLVVVILLENSDTISMASRATLIAETLLSAGK